MIKYRVIRVFILFCLALSPTWVFSQKDPVTPDILLHPDRFYKRFFPRLRVKRNPPDSTFIKIYPNYFSIGIHVLSPSIGVDIYPRGPKTVGFDPASKFRTNIADVVGLSASYKFVSFGFALLLKSGMNTHENYAPSHYHTATIKYHSAANSFQFKYLRIQGFTDINQSNPLRPGMPYIQRPDMVSKDFQFEGIYNFSWKTYSYIGPLNFSQRQIKSRAGFLLKGGVYYNQLSSDSTLIRQQQKSYYEGFNNIKAIRSLSIRIAPGVGGNLIILKRIYFSAAAFTSFDIYYYKYLNLLDDKVDPSRAFVFTLDGQASLGYQSKRLYAGLRYEAQRRTGPLHSMRFDALYTYTGIELGYRFDAPKLIAKVYKKTMPPRI